MQNTVMNSRRSRLSLVRRSESPMSPIDDRTRSSISELDIASSGCSTPLNTRKRSSPDSPVFLGNDQSPIPMSQDASNIVTGVSWAWNSPKRAVVPDHKFRSRPLTSRNVITNKDPDLSRSNRKTSTRKLTGFHRFQTELKLLQERDEPLKTMKTPSISSMEVVPPTSPPPSPDKDVIFDVHRATNTDAISAKKASFFKPNPTSVASDSFNDSELDNLLLKASQAVEKQSNIHTASTNRVTTAAEKPSEKRRSFFKSKTANNFGGNSDDSLADAELESILAQIHSQIGQSAETTGVITHDNRTVTGSSKPKGLLTRHKSMPESPNHMIMKSSNSRSSNSEYVKGIVQVVQSPITVSSSSSVNSSSSQQQPVRVCSMEEIEQKRQEALKRQACRLKRLMQGNHSQGDFKLTKSRK